MSDQRSSPSSQPPTAPAGPLDYARPQPESRPRPRHGLNLRPMDNLVQLGCVIVASLSGVGLGAMVATKPGGELLPIVGGFMGIVAGLVVPGVVIGMIRKDRTG